MTNEEAIELIKSALKTMYLPKSKEYISDFGYALDMAIKALETIPKYMDAYNKGWDDGAKATYEHLKMCEEEESDDLISRDELLKAIDTWDKFGVDDTNSLFRLDNLSLPHYVPYIHYDDVVKCIKGMPSVNPQEPETGHWEWLTEDKYRCSNCNSETRVDECMNVPMYDFCPFCGARMESE